MTTNENKIFPFYIFLKGDLGVGRTFLFSIGLFFFLFLTVRSLSRGQSH